MKTCKMKRLAFIMMLVCTFCMAHAQNLRNHRYSNGEELKVLEELVDQFCRYVEIVGSTDSYSESIKNKIRTDSVKPLFYKYEQRKMITTNSYGTSTKPMRQYFRNLQVQASKPKNISADKTEINYRLDFEFAGENGKLEWYYSHTEDDGSKVYIATVYIYQTYMKKTLRGYETIRNRTEVDKKEMKVRKVVIPTTNKEIIKLYDVTSAESLHKEG